jgi:ADP-ribose pyrophosphatase YjhB (NUDIX family)
VAVDTALLTVGPTSSRGDGRPELDLLVLLTATDPTSEERRWALPGTFLHEGERLREAVARSLRDKVGLSRPLAMTQLDVFDKPDRDYRGWVLSVGHLAAVRYESLAGLVAERPDALRLVSASRPGRLPYDHGEIVGEAVRVLRRRYQDEPDPFRLLGREFTMSELRHAHEAVQSESLQRDTFRRLMEPKLTATGETAGGRMGRPSQIYRRR